MHKPVALFEIAVENEVKMVVHQTECQDCTFVVLQHNEDSVHPHNEILPVEEDSVDDIAVCAKVPAIAYRNLLTLGKSGV